MKSLAEGIKKAERMIKNKTLCPFKQHRKFNEIVDLIEVDIDDARFSTITSAELAQLLRRRAADLDALRRGL